MRVWSASFLLACSGPVDDVLVRDFDATIDGGSFGDVALQPFQDAEAGEPIFTGGPIACGKCTCDGTLYACLEGLFTLDGGCTSTGKPPPPPPPSDASTDAGDASCGATCLQIPIACLPKPTCACIEKELNVFCTIAPDGRGFALGCE